MKVMLDKGAIMPTKAHKTDAGFDLYTPVDIEVKRDWHAFVDTGVHVEIPEGYVGMIKSKSGLNKDHDLTMEGVIDCGYTGSIGVKIYNHGAVDYNFKAGDKLTQLVIMPIGMTELELVDSLEETERGDGGFGSTGK